MRAACTSFLYAVGILLLVAVARPPAMSQWARSGWLDLGFVRFQPVGS
jgi:cell division protein FtsW (lipid II flippase)